MHSIFFKAAWLPLCAIAGLHFLSAPAWAQATPADAPASVPAAVYRSPFAGYQSFTEPAVVPWRDANEQVRRRGGWRAYAREANEPAATPKPAEASASAPMPDPHAGHADHPAK